MKYLMLGVFISLFFKKQIIKICNLSNQNVSMLGTILGWFLEEYIEEIYDLDGGKFILTNFKFKNEIILKGLIILSKLYGYVYLFIVIELLFFFSLIGLIPIYVKTLKKNHKFIFYVIYISILYIFLMDLKVSLLTLLFIFKLIIIFLFLIIYIYITILIGYLTYIFFIKTFYLKTLAIFLHLFIDKCILYIIFFIVFLFLIDYELNSLYNNLLKEIFFKFIFLFIKLRNANYKPTLSYKT